MTTQEDMDKYMTEIFNILLRLDCAEEMLGALSGSLAGVLVKTSPNEGAARVFLDDVVGAVQKVIAMAPADKFRGKVH